MSYTLSLDSLVTAQCGTQRILLKVDGDTIIDVDYRADYTEEQGAERLPRLSLAQALPYVAGLCHSCSYAHSLVFCQALETLLDIEPSDRVDLLRCIVTELERLASHLDSLTAMFHALGQSHTRNDLSLVHQSAKQLLRLFRGSEDGPILLQPGGVSRNLDDQSRRELLSGLKEINQRLFQITDRVIDQQALLARTVEIGVLSRDAAAQFVLSGPMARASGLLVDLRQNQPYAGYRHLDVSMIAQDSGDVYARMIVFLLESIESVKLAEQALHMLPDDRWQGFIPNELRAGQASSAVEAPRGILRYHLESDGIRITSATIEPPTRIDRLLARTLLSGSWIDNAPLVVYSTGPCVAN